MNLFEMEDDMPKMVVLCVAILGVTIIGFTVFTYINESSIHGDAFKNGYEELVDTNGYKLWKKSGKEQ